MMGKGIIHISEELYKDVMSDKEDDSYKTMEEAFLFPEGMKIISSSLHYYFDKDDVLLKVEHTDIPEKDEYKRLPDITLRYQRNDRGEVKLLDWLVKEYT